MPKLSPEQLESVKHWIMISPNTAIAFNAWKSMQDTTDLDSLIEKFYFKYLAMFTEGYSFNNFIWMIVMMMFPAMTIAAYVYLQKEGENSYLWLPILGFFVSLLIIMLIVKFYYYDIFIKK